jgi:uncharacterized repeat protein (TIGR03803 family)
MTKLQTSGFPFLLKRGTRAFIWRQIGLWRTISIALVFCAAVAVTSSAKTFTTLVSFDGANGSSPQYVSLVQGLDGNFYGTTLEGGANGHGTVLKITLAGKLTTLYSFCSQTNCTDGANPYAGLVLGTDGNFYGTTYQGGAQCSYIEGCGTVFKITPAGTLTTLYSFCSQTNCSDGLYPYAVLVQASNGNFYGTTFAGGALACSHTPFGGCGTIFEITPAGSLTTVYSFCPDYPTCSDGAAPNGLVQATSGDFYGTTFAGGASELCGSSYGSGCGTVFQITPGGSLTTLYSFCIQTSCSDGELPYAGLVQATNGNFYGTTSVGGTGFDGTVFEINPSGKLTTLYSFCSQTNCTDGANPYAGVIQATNGNFYGTTGAGGANGSYGTVFEISPAGKLTTLYSFCPQTNCTDGEFPFGGLLQATNGNFYGTTNQGGAKGDGTVFSLSVGFGPFVETQPASGKVGAKVIVLGNNLTGSTSVTFNGTAATFTVVSSTEITTTVPTGATTGTVEVATPSGTLKSNVKFRVMP